MEYSELDVDEKDLEYAEAMNGRVIGVQTKPDKKIEQDAIAMNWVLTEDKKKMILGLNLVNLRRVALQQFFETSHLLYRWASDLLNSPQVYNDYGMASAIVHSLTHTDKYVHVGTMKIDGKVGWCDVELPPFYAAILKPPFELGIDGACLNLALLNIRTPDHVLFLSSRCWNCHLPCTKICVKCKLAFFCCRECKEQAKSTHSQICRKPNPEDRRRYADHFEWM